MVAPTVDVFIASLQPFVRAANVLAATLKVTYILMAGTAVKRSRYASLLKNDLDAHLR
jgi:hypothetical protein